MEDRNNLTPKELYDLKKAEKKQINSKEKSREKVNALPKKIGKLIFYLLIIVVVFGGIAWLISLTPNLPTTTSEGHSEDSPVAHIITTPMSTPIQSHMLEHADGGTKQSGIGGIIIQYNCDDYDCAPDLVKKLTALVEQYPENVYLAPNRYDGKIILTKLGKRKVMDEFDEQTIRDFIK